MVDISPISPDILSQTTEIYATDKRLDSFSETLKKASESGEDRELLKACVEFESYFLQTLYKSMRKTVPENYGLIPKSNGEKIFQEMLDEEVAAQAAKAGGVGLAAFMYRQLKISEPSNGTSD